MSEILNIRKAAHRVDDVTNIQYHTYTPYSTAFQNNDETRLIIQSQESTVLPSDSYLIIEFKPTLADGKPIEHHHDYKFTRACGLRFFSEMRYELNGIEIDRCKSPAITSQLKTMIACKTSDAHALQSLTWLDDKKISYSNYRIMIPLKFVFGFFDDYNRVVVNSKHELILVRSHEDNDVYISNSNDKKLHFNVTKIHWKVPHVRLSHHAKTGMLKSIGRNEKIPLTFRSWDLYEMPHVLQTDRNIWSVKTTTQITKPRYVVVAFQTDRNNVPIADPKLFDHCNILNVRLYLNDDRYPYDDMNLDFKTDSDFCEVFNMMDQIQYGYYNGTQGKNPVDLLKSILSKEIIFFAFDCSRSDEGSRNAMVDVRIEMDARENFPANTIAYCLVIHDNHVRYCPSTGIVDRQVA